MTPVKRAIRIKVEAMLLSLPAPHAARLRGLYHPVRTWEQAMCDMLADRATRD